MNVRAIVSLFTRTADGMEVSTAVKAFIEACKANGLRPSTLRWYNQRLSRIARFLEEQEVSRVEQVTATHLRRFINHLRSQTSRWDNHEYRPSAEGGLSLHTIDSYLRVLQTFFRWLVEERVIDRNPAKQIKRPRLPNDPPKEILDADLKKLLQIAEPDPRDYAIVCFLADTGCRVGGLASLTLTHLYVDEGRAIVLEKGRGGEKARPVFFNGRTQDALRCWLKARPETANDHVFLSRTGNPLQPIGVYQVLKRLAIAAAVKGRFNPHSFRHHWAHCALRRGASLGDVSQMLGHSDISVTVKYYGIWSEEELKARHGHLSPLSGTRSIR